MILATTVPTFFMRVKPTSSMAKPACMNSTRSGGDDHPHGVGGDPGCLGRGVVGRRGRSAAARPARRRRRRRVVMRVRRSNGVLLGRLVACGQRRKTAGHLRCARRHNLCSEHLCARHKLRATGSPGDGRHLRRSRPCRMPPTAGMHLADAQAEMEVEPGGRVVEAQAADLLDASQPVQHGVAVDVEPLRRSRSASRGSGRRRRASPSGRRRCARRRRRAAPRVWR